MLCIIIFGVDMMSKLKKAMAIYLVGYIMAFGGAMCFGSGAITNHINDMIFGGIVLAIGVCISVYSLNYAAKNL